MRDFQPRFAASAHLRTVIWRGGVVRAVVIGVVVLASVMSARSVAADQFLTITDAGYRPAAITIHQGEKLTWLNSGAVAHSVTARDGSFDSGPIAPGERYGNVFTELGTFNYGSSSDPSFQGQVVVLAIGASEIPSPTPGTASTPPALPFGQTISTPAPGVSSGGGSNEATTVLIAIVGSVMVIGLAALASLRRRRL